MTEVLTWMCYDNSADEIIGLWNKYEDAEMFLLDNQALEDNWALFPASRCFEEQGLTPFSLVSNE